MTIVNTDSRNSNLPSEPAPVLSSVVSSPRLLRRIGRRLLIGLAVLLCLAGAGMLYQATATVADRRTSTPAGRLVDIDGHRMHLHCTGTGSPTVLLESGAGAPSSVWAWVQPAVAEQTRVCSYDRSGIGWLSEESVDEPEP